MRAGQSHALYFSFISTAWPLVVAHGHFEGDEEVAVGIGRGKQWGRCNGSVHGCTRIRDGVRSEALYTLGAAFNVEVTVLQL